MLQQGLLFAGVIDLMFKPVELNEEATSNQYTAYHSVFSKSPLQSRWLGIVR